jgi:hypothetical protein
MSVAVTIKILADTSGSPMKLAFEVVNSCNNNTPQSHLHLMEDVGDERVKMTLGPCSMLHPGTIFRISASICSAMTFSAATPRTSYGTRYCRTSKVSHLVTAGWTTKRIGRA